MPDVSHDELLARLTGQQQPGQADPWAAVAASQPQHAAKERKAPAKTEPDEEEVEALVERIREMASPRQAEPPAAAAEAARPEAVGRGVRRFAGLGELDSRCLLPGRTYVVRRRRNNDQRRQRLDSEADALAGRSRGARNPRTHQAAVPPGRRVVAAIEKRPVRRSQGRRADERLHLPAHRSGSRTGPAIGRTLHVLRRGPRLAGAIHRRRRQAIADAAASYGRRSAAGLFRFADQSQDAAAAGAGDQLRPRLVPVRTHRAMARRASPSG